MGPIHVLCCIDMSSIHASAQHMGPAFSRNSVLWHFKGSNAVDICDEIMLTSTWECQRWQEASMLNPCRLPYCCWTLKEHLITSRQWRTVQPFLLSVPWSPLCRFAPSSRPPTQLNHLCCLIALFPSIPDSSVWYCSDWSWEQPGRWDYCLLNLCLSVCLSVTPLLIYTGV